MALASLKSPRTLLNIGLLVVVAALVLVVVYKPGKPKPANTKLTEVEFATINRITLDRLGNPPIVFNKVNDQWQMSTPYAMKANKIQVEGLLDLLAYNFHARYDLAKLDKKTYGLDQPRATITFNDQYKFEFGITEPMNNQRYIAYQDQLYLTDDYFQHRILGHPSSFLDHALIPLGEITALEIPGLSLSNNSGRWDVMPRPEKFSNDQANELIEHWKYAHAIEIAPYADEPSAGTIRIHLSGQEKPLQYEIINKDKDFYLARSDVKLMYKLASEKRRDLLSLPAPLDINSKPAPAKDHAKP